ncbi:hypothetical protein D0S45_00495 [Marinifilum sp. JC120]|nr:hypothetical protein D0S45_00495 [Marinifilum sp. JC120]
MITSKIRLNFSVLLTVILIFSFCGCKSINKLRSAQDSFNQAAELNNQQNFGSISFEGISVTDLAKQNESALLYQETNQILNDFSEKEREDLKKNNLYGNYLVLKGLTNWKLENYDAVYKVVAEAADKEINFTTRDKGIIQIMPALIAVEEAKPFYQNASEQHDKNCFNLNKAMSIIKDAPLGDVEKVISNTATPANLRLYAIQCNLLAHHYRIEAYRSAKDDLSSNEKCIKKRTSSYDQSRQKTLDLISLLEKMKKKSQSEELTTIYNYWRSVTDK